MTPWVCTAAVSAIATICLTAGCAGDSTDKTQTCLNTQAEGYPRVESVIASTFRGVDYDLERFDDCEEFGYTRTSSLVLAWLPPDVNRRDADELLLDQGWERRPDTTNVFDLAGTERSYHASVVADISSGQRTMVVYVNIRT